MNTVDMNTLDEYQLAAAAIAAGPGDNPTLELAIFGLGIAGEAGEVADLLKKHLGHGHALDVDKLRKELGDVLWYTAMIAHRHGLALSEVAAANLHKLQKRYPNGFSSEASQARVDELESLTR